MSISFESFIYKSSSFKSFIYRALASKASFTELQLQKVSFTKLQLRKLHLQSSSFKASLAKLHLQSFTCKASPTKLQCRVYKYRLQPTAIQAHTWIQFEVSSQQTLLTEDLGDYTMYHILGLIKNTLGTQPIIYVLRSEPLFYKRDSLTFIREHRRQMSIRLAASITPNPSLMY